MIPQFGYNAPNQSDHALPAKVGFWTLAELPENDLSVVIKAVYSNTTSNATISGLARGVQQLSKGMAQLQLEAFTDPLVIQVIVLNETSTAMVVN
jgi:hypothetical protein